MATKQSVYTLNHDIDTVEKNRLDFQHDLFFKQTGCKLIPDNVALHLATLGRPTAVADMGTGTGVWLRHLATQLPLSSRLDGYDFDTSKFPNASQLPDNVKLSFADTMKPFPQEILGIYDVVHVRALMYALKAHEWATAVANLRTLLKPGGYLFWEEVGYPTWLCLPMTETFAKWITADVRYAASVGRDISSPLHLKDQVSDAGYTNTTSQEWSTFSLPQSDQKTVGTILNAVARQSMRGIIDRGGFEWIKTYHDVDEVIDKIQSDVNSSATQLGWTMYWVVGQNPAK